MSIFKITLADLVSNILPPKKRTDENKAILSGLLSSWDRKQKSQYEFKTGSSYPDYAAGTYDKYDVVTFEKGIYECQVDGTTTDPTDTTAWIRLNSSFIGSNESQLFDGGKLILEYALNTWFGTTFNQPPTLSDIYITNNVIPDPAFLIGYNNNSSAVGYDESTEFIVYDYTSGANPPNFAINVPVAFYTALGADAEQIIRDYADKYVAASITYEIITY